LYVIYIPIWFYSNGVQGFQGETGATFTFQYGSTQMQALAVGVVDIYTFTFQYGSTQIISSDKRIAFSFLFTFQYGSTQIKIFKKGADKYKKFTFQYGSTQMQAPYLRAVFASAFTFQYGSTQISKNNENCCCFIIYIPIWFYSNYIQCPMLSTLTLFTFQYGSTQINLDKLKEERDNYLHSNMVLLK